jgi:hypothetical protein
VDDADIFGIVCRTDDAINAPVEQIHQLCVEPGLDLELASNPREKEKLLPPAGGEGAPARNSTKLRETPRVPWPNKAWNRI